MSNSVWCSACNSLTPPLCGECTQEAMRKYDGPLVSLARAYARLGRLPQWIAETEKAAAENIQRLMGPGEIREVPLPGQRRLHCATCNATRDTYRVGKGSHIAQGTVCCYPAGHVLYPPEQPDYSATQPTSHVAELERQLYHAWQEEKAPQPKTHDVRTCACDTCRRALSRAQEEARMHTRGTPSVPQPIPARTPGRVREGMFRILSSGAIVSCHTTTLLSCHRCGETQEHAYLKALQCGHMVCMACPHECDAACPTTTRTGQGSSHPPPPRTWA